MRKIALMKTESPLARLVLFMVCLSVAGSIVAGAYYYAVDLPQQQDVQVPRNDCSYQVGWNLWFSTSLSQMWCYCSTTCCPEGRTQCKTVYPGDTL
jgi:hypothetical protein